MSDSLQPGMQVAAHADYAAIARRMRRAAMQIARPWAGIMHRAAPPRWAGRGNMINGKGSFLSGGRFNAAGSFPALYASTTPELAIMESLAFQRRAGLPTEHALPLVVRAIETKLERAIDLTEPDTLRRLDIDADMLAKDRWWVDRANGLESYSQAVGRAAHDAGIQAIVAASAHEARFGANVIVFPNLVAGDSFVRALRAKPR